MNTAKHTKYEKARMVGSRALQLSMGAPILLKMSKKEMESLKYNPIKIALKEYESGVLPITVKRPLPRTKKTKKKE
ncbi:DNA-directed RNA polymerase subunit K [Candidatus Woesearchaeota archaeon]|jgi:DNA-directed RNA polymerase subunit K/omega|nr:DNA-directed RNA polymerase subunit K [Candidatus Woesearchaeota archaeon]